MPETQLLALPDGNKGTLMTLQKMRLFVREYVSNYPVIKFTRALVKDIPEKDVFKEAVRIQQFVRDEIRYVRDPRLVESIQTPVVTLDVGQGDCDDKSILVATMLEVLGFKTRLVAVALNNNPYFSHVLVEVLIKNRWFSVETTEKVDFGWYPNNVSNRLVVDI